MNAAQQILDHLGARLGNRPTKPAKAIGKLIWASSEFREITNPLTGLVSQIKVQVDGTYRQPDNNRRLKRLAIRDHGFRQFKKQGVLRQYNIARKEAPNV